MGGVVAKAATGSELKKPGNFRRKESRDSGGLSEPIGASADRKLY